MNEIPKAYEPQSVEDKWYDFWLKHGCFTADPSRVSEKRPAYSIVIPPPNVTGVLHMGHVLNNTIQDILSRKARMDGKEVLWLPGTDHAGISTEGMVVKQLRKEEKKSKQDIGREEFLKRVWAWKEKQGGIIIQQLKKLGCSCDWTRERFTMDPEYVRCVQKVFVDLYKKGLIYRGKRMVNWCPATQTALSDEEVEMKPQKGFMYHFNVAVAESGSSRGNEAPSEKSEIRNPKSEIDQSLLTSAPTDEKKSFGPVTDAEGRLWLTIATTRPETIPGDTAVAVNPKDPRYAHLIGKHVVRPLPVQLPREQKLIPIIGDEHVDFEFGTGVLKVTPAHDKADFDIGQRHKLPIVDIMNPDGTMNELAGESLAGLDRFEARAVAVERLKEIGALVKEEPYENNVGFSQRADVPIEPRLSEQWFLKYPAVEQSKACVEQEDDSGSARAPRAAVGAPADGSEEEASSSGVDKFGRPIAADEASAAAREGACAPQKMQFHPQRWAKVYDHWLTNIQDWCISRQLWWGHRIPVWRKVWKTEEYRGDVEQHARIKSYLQKLEMDRRRELVVCKLADDPAKSSREGNPPETVTLEICIEPSAEDIAEEFESFGFTQDPDVLDTWFSSWLWPFATMGWTSDKSQDSRNPTLQAFYPTTDLVTAPEIIFFWVARMIMAGFEYMGDLPFRNVYFTGIVRDKQGRKMSKTLGNSPDPLDLIAKYGADAIRFGTMRSAPLGQDVLFDEKDVELGRNFCNKLWNACRFRQMQSAAGILPADRTGADANSGQDFQQDAGSTLEGEINPALLTSDDKWILLRLDQAIREVTQAFADYKFNEATATLYRFFWSEYCDWYVEASKAALGGAVTSLQSYKVTSGSHATMQPCNDVTLSALRGNKLAVIDFVLSHTLRLFHPFMPFITEELWQGMGFNRDLPADQGGNTIMFAPWPKPFSDEEKSFFGLDDAADKIATAKYELVSLGRNLRHELKLDPAKKLKFVLKPAGELPPAEIEVLRLLLNAEAVEVDARYLPPKGTPMATNAVGELYLPLEGVLDVGAETTRLQKELAKIDAEIEKVQSKLNNPNFAQKVPPQVLEEHKQRLGDWETKRRQSQSALDALSG